MPSPFPGMNPYLEQETVWHDFHESFMPAAREVLAAQLRPRFIVKIDEHVFIHELPGEPSRFIGRGDVTIAKSRRRGISPRAAVATLAPARVRLPLVDEVRLSFLEIRDRRDGRLVTVIELLSPANKNPGSDREQYLGKRSQLLRSTAHFVEIDLLRGGPRMPMQDLPACDYCVLVSRVEDRPDANIWPIGLRDSLPVIPIPVSADPSDDAALDLKAILDREYDAAGYEDYIYSGQPRPRLAPKVAKWARTFVP